MAKPLPPSPETMTKSPWPYSGPMVKSSPLPSGAVTIISPDGKEIPASHFTNVPVPEGFDVNVSTLRQG